MTKVEKHSSTARVNNLLPMQERSLSEVCVRHCIQESKAGEGIGPQPKVADGIILTQFWFLSKTHFSVCCPFSF